MGVALVLISATAFGTNAIFAKLAYAVGLATTQTLAYRFVIAALGMWGLALALGQNPMRFAPRRLLALFALGKEQTALIRRSGERYAAILQ